MVPDVMITLLNRSKTGRIARAGSRHLSNTGIIGFHKPTAACIGPGRTRSERSDSEWSRFRSRRAPRLARTLNQGENKRRGVSYEEKPLHLSRTWQPVWRSLLFFAKTQTRQVLSTRGSVQEIVAAQHRTWVKLKRNIS
jgi:hypothetical protein